MRLIRFITILRFSTLVLPLAGWAAQIVTHPAANPNGIFINETASVTFTAQVGADPTLIVNSVTLVQYDSNRQLIGPVGRMYDDGTHGDQRPGDTLFTLQVPINQSTPTTFYYRVSVAYRGSLLRTLSPFFTLDVVAHISDAELTPALTVPNAGFQQYMTFINQGSSPSNARDRTIAYLLQQPSVLQAGAADGGGYGIWILYTSGLLGGIDLLPANVKGASPSGVASMKPAAARRASKIPIALFASVSTTTADPVGNSKAVSIGAFHTTSGGIPGFEPNDEPDEIATLGRNAACPLTVDELYNGQVTLASLKVLADYGTIIISSHGDTFYQGILSLWSQRFRWNFIGAQVVIFTRESVSAANRAAYDVDLRMGRIAIFQQALIAILPSFITQYATNLPQSLVYLSSCRSAYNTSMSDAFLGNGAKVVYGYSNYVDASFSNTTGIQLFTDLINNNKTAGQAFTPGMCDSSNPPACFIMFGDANLTLPSNVVSNGSFETGDFNGWTVGGAFYSDVVTDNVTDGTYAARLGRWDQVYSGGLNGPPVGSEPGGYDSIQQDVQLPNVTPQASTITLTFDYHILTFDAGIYDWFDMLIQDPVTGATLATVVTHDGKPGSDYGTFYDGGLKHVSYDLTAFAGKKIRLFFGTFQDGFGDQTATFVDNVKINCH